MQLGNPSNATADVANHTHYLIQRDQYALDYNDTTREPNWVAWDLTSADIGGSGRAPDFYVDATLPTSFYRVLTTDYSGSGYDRGHMCPSADRTATTADNQFTFYMSNMVPQSPDNNQGVWASFETYCRTLAAAGNELLIISGPSGSGAATIASGVAIPDYTWKIAVVVPLGAGAALDRITAATRVIAIKIPNIAGVRSNPWQQYITSVAQLETDTGYAFFTALPTALAATLRAKTDDSSVVGAPRITTSPSAQATPLGGTATFTVAAAGNAPLTYQWSLDGNELAGATAATLSVANVQVANVGNYSVVVANALGSITSNVAALTLGSASDSEAIAWDFSSAAPTSGLPAGLSGGTVTQGGNNGTTALLTSVSVSSGYAGVSGGNNAGAAARIGPLNQAATTGSAYFEFTLAAAAGRELVVSSLSFGTRSTGTGPQAFALFTSLDNFTTPVATGPLANNSVWTFIAPTFSAFSATPGTAVTFRLYGFNGAGNASTSTANWRIDDLKLGISAVANSATAPVITTAPKSQAVGLGGGLVLSVAATGTGPFTYQWRFDGTPIAGATSATYIVASATAATAGSYTVAVTSNGGTTISAPAVITTAAAIPVLLTNLSVLTTAGPGAQTLTVGFVLGGTGTKTLLIRGIGPGLTAYGVASPIADPVLTLLGPDSQTLVAAANDNWSSTITAAMAATGAFALTPGGRDAAVITPALAPGNYTTQITGATAGQALAEIYDPAIGTGAKLINLSTLAQVPASGTLTAGFTISGNVAKTVLIRGIGPGLAAFGVGGALATPVLSLLDASGNLLQTNTGWGATLALRTAFTQTGAFSLGTTATPDSALLVTLAPGGYTAQVSGSNNTSGTALVEVYEVP